VTELVRVAAVELTVGVGQIKADGSAVSVSVASVVVEDDEEACEEVVLLAVEDVGVVTSSIGADVVVVPELAKVVVVV